MDQPRWLDESELALWRSFLECTSRILDTVGNSVKAGTGLRFEDHEVLVALSYAQDGLIMSELSERLLHSRSRVTQRVNRLEQAGLVERAQCTTDRRRMICSLTKPGRQLVDEFAPTHVSDVRNAFIDLLTTDDQLALARIFADLCELSAKAKS